jgi:hypothetical protein
VDVLGQLLAHILLNPARSILDAAQGRFQIVRNHVSKLVQLFIAPL